MEDEASISFGPLKIWIEGRQFPESKDYWDANWLMTTAECVGKGSSVKADGPFLHLGELKYWKDNLEAFHKTLKGRVELPTAEPTLKIKIMEQKPEMGHFLCEIEFTGDYLNEVHKFIFQADQSYIPSLLNQLNTVLRNYPIVGKQKL